MHCPKAQSQEEARWGLRLAVVSAGTQPQPCSREHCRAYRSMSQTLTFAFPEASWVHHLDSAIQERWQVLQGQDQERENPPGWRKQTPILCPLCLP